MMNVAVIGAGLMGHALALVFALGGHKVRLTDNNPETLARAPRLMESALALLVQGGEADATWDRRRLAAAVRCCASLGETVAGAQFVVEAIIETPEAKRKLYEQLDALMDHECILASNTSHLDVFPLVPAARQKRALIAHWYTPPYLCDLVDVVPGPQTDPAVLAQVAEMMRAMGKEPVVFKKFVAGYVANRIQAAIALEVYDLLDQGVVSAQDIDRSVIHGLALRIPILAVLAKADFTGLPLLQQAAANRSYAPPVARGGCETLDRLLAQGRTGVMSGKGFFDWGDKGPEALFRERDQKLLALKHALREIKPMEGK
jgi:3-hydroxybutyryl-CoA dehydrogenase